MQSSKVEIRTVADALAWGSGWERYAHEVEMALKAAEFRLQYALADESQRDEMWHSCPWPRGSQRVFGERVNWLYLIHT